MTKQSRYSYSETVERLAKAITAGGNTIFATIDQAAAAEASGLALRPTTLVIFGNPKGGTPLMDAFPLVALELPLKLLVWQDDNGVKIAYERCRRSPRDPVSTEWTSASRRWIARSTR